MASQERNQISENQIGDHSDRALGSLGIGDQRVEVAEPKTEIFSNGSKWAGEEPDTIEVLLARLETEPLDRTFEAYGNFVAVDPVNIRGDALLPPGGVSFFGNFHTVSHVFNIHTTDGDVIERLTTAIRKNQQRSDYLSQPDEIERQAQADAAALARCDKEDAERERQLQSELRHLAGRKRERAA